MKNKKQKGSAEKFIAVDVSGRPRFLLVGSEIFELVPVDDDGAVKKTRKDATVKKTKKVGTRHCKKCGKPGHRSDNCPN